MNIAVLEEHPTVGEMLQHSLELAGYSVVLCSHPAQFFSALLAPASVPFDCIIIDLPLTEEISAGEVLQRARKTFPVLPAILIAEGSSWEIEAARRSSPGVEVLRKPFKLSKLLSLLNQLIN